MVQNEAENQSDNEQSELELSIVMSCKEAVNRFALLLNDEKNLAYYYAETFAPVDGVDDILNWGGYRVQPMRIDPARVAPKYTSTKMKGVRVREDTVSFYLKPVPWFRPGKFNERLFTGEPPVLIVDREIQNCEVLRRHPHPNVCAYHGVTVGEDGYVTNLVFDRYSSDLLNYVDKGGVVNVKDFLGQIEAGLKHIHRLGYVHVDVKPANVFVDEEADPVRYAIGDFDSMHEQGRYAEHKGWTPKWASKELTDVGIVVVEMDFYGLKKVQEWLAEKGHVVEEEPPDEE